MQKETDAWPPEFGCCVVGVAFMHRVEERRGKELLVFGWIHSAWGLFSSRYTNCVSET